MRAVASDLLGPFNRYVIWTQGCLKNCSGCVAQQARPIEAGVLVEIGDLAQSIAATPGIEGLTLSGGEPFLQAEGLVELLALIRRDNRLGVIIYSGYALEELKAGCAAGVAPDYAAALLDMCDLLIDGPYIESLDDEKSLRGSSNQRIHCLSSRYAGIIDRYYGLEQRKTEIRIMEDRVELLGIPGRSTLEAWQRLKARI